MKRLAFMHVSVVHFSIQVSAMLDHDARIVKAGALAPLCKMLLSSLVTTQEYTSGLLRNLVAYNAGAYALGSCFLASLYFVYRCQTASV